MSIINQANLMLFFQNNEGHMWESLWKKVLLLIMDCERRGGLCLCSFSFSLIIKDQMMYISLDLYICVVVKINLLSSFPRGLLRGSRFLDKGEEEKIMTAEKSMQINPKYWEGRWVLFTLFGFDFNSSTEKHSREKLSLSFFRAEKVQSEHVRSLMTPQVKLWEN